MLGKISILFILSWLLFLICPLYAQDTQTDIALELAKVKERVQKLEKENIKLKAQPWFEKVGNIATIFLSVFTIVLAVSTIFLARATQIYAKATKELVKGNKALIRATKLSAIVQTALNWTAGGQNTAYWYDMGEFKSERGKHEKKIAEKLPSFIAEILADDE